ncbi:hypothetical protein V8F33_011477 [Rhypophila sp. PSN 637]
MVLVLLLFHRNLQKVKDGITLRLKGDKLHQYVRNNYYFGGVASRYEEGKVYVGWCPNPTAKNSLNCKFSPDSGVSPIEKLEEQAARSSVTDFSFFSRFTFLGLAVGISKTVKKKRNINKV